MAQNDIKRIIAYSTISQLGYMMMGLGVGGVAVGMFHLITHAFFKSLLFLGAGSVIHGCHGEQDIRKMGGLRKLMPWTFATYAAGMMALCGVPLFFSGFWSKDEILRAALELARFAGALLSRRGGRVSDGLLYDTAGELGVFRKTGRCGKSHAPAHESPAGDDDPSGHPGGVCRAGRVFGNAGLALVPFLFERRNTPVRRRRRLSAGPQLNLMLLSTAGRRRGFLAGLANLFQGRRRKAPGKLTRWKNPCPALFRLLQNKFFIDEFYAATVIRLNAAFARLRRLDGSRDLGGRGQRGVGVDGRVRADQSRL